MVQPRKTRSYITERLLMDVKNQIKQTITKLYFYLRYSDTYTLLFKLMGKKIITFLRSKCFLICTLPITYFQDSLQDQLNKLKRLAAERTKNLEQSKWMHAYLRESGDFEEWINEQVQTASSEEFGQDYEHLCVSL